MSDNAAYESDYPAKSGSITVPVRVMLKGDGIDPTSFPISDLDGEYWLRVLTRLNFLSKDLIHLSSLVDRLRAHGDTDSFKELGFHSVADGVNQIGERLEALIDDTGGIGVLLDTAFDVRASREIG